jgi:hypothetical protein
MTRKRGSDDPRGSGEKRSIYKVVFQAQVQGQAQVVELYARLVTQSGIFGFIELEDLLFGQKSELVVDPSEEALRSEYGTARRLHLPLHAILRIEEVEKEGSARVRQGKESSGLVTPFPLPVWTPGRGPHQG